MPLTEAQKRYERKRSKETMIFSMKYNPIEKSEGKRLKKYLNESGLTANSYLKSLVKADLDSKNISYPTNTEDK